jgi:hypothetical protein
MKKYVLILFKDIMREELPTEIVSLLTPIVDSKFLKFHHNRGSLVLHFESEVDQSELVPFIEGILFGIVSSFILSELNDKMSLRMPKDVLEHLLDLENEGDGTYKIDMNQYQIDYDEENDEDFIGLLLEDVKKKIKRPTLDQILEKIKTKGINSLSQYEKDTLEEYSKN